jgi:hypothetical protein
MIINNTISREEWRNVCLQNQLLNELLTKDISLERELQIRSELNKLENKNYFKPIKLNFQKALKLVQ